MLFLNRCSDTFEERREEVINAQLEKRKSYAKAGSLCAATVMFACRAPK